MMDAQLQRRLSLVDMFLYYWGRIQRKDLSRHFGIGPVTASRVLKVYNDLHPHNIEFSVSNRAYIIASNFKCEYESDVEAALMLLAYGIESRPMDTTTYGPARITGFTAPLVKEWVSAITRAMVASRGVGIRYISGSGEKSRTVHPHAIFQSGTAWYFRAYDVSKQEFRTFRFSRIIGLSEITKATYDASPEGDDDWNAHVTLTLSPHEGHHSPEALAMDLGLQGRPVSNASVKRAMAGFVLTDLRVDCSLASSLDPNEFPLRLQNRAELLDVESMLLAPGFDE